MLSKKTERRENMKYKKVIATLMLSTTLLSVTGSAVNVFAAEGLNTSTEQTNNEQSQIVNIPDANLKKAIKMFLGISKEEITISDMQKLTSLESYSGISDLTGLEYATNLNELILDGNKVKDFSPLNNLSDLSCISLNDMTAEDTVQKVEDNTLTVQVLALPQQLKGRKLIITPNDGGIYNENTKTITWKNINEKTTSVSYTWSDSNSPYSAQCSGKLTIPISNVQKEDSKDRQKLSEAEKAIDGLFTDTDHTMIKEQISQNDIDAVKNLVDQLPESQNKNVLLGQLDKAVVLHSQLKTCIQSVDSLFQDSTHKALNSEITSDNVWQERSIMATTCVSELPNTPEKTRLSDLISSAKGLFDEFIYEQSATATIPDAQLRIGLNKALGKGTNDTEDITVKSLENLKGKLDLSKQKIQHLQGLEYCKNITSLDLSDNNIRDNGYSMRMIAQLTQLKSLNLQGNGIYDIHELSKLKNLDEINVSKQIRLISRDSYLSSEFIDAKTMKNPAIDENGKVIPISKENIHMKKAYSEEVYHPVVAYDKAKNQIHWNYDAFNGHCYNPWQPIVLFRKKVKIGKAAGDFSGAFYMTLEKGFWPDNIQDNSAHYRALQYLNDFN